jgi:tetratricopeptide (TPR) repeat protein
MSENQEEIVQPEKKGFDVQEKMDKAELFFDQNKKLVSIVLGAIGLIVGAYLFYKFYILANQEKDAQKVAFYSFINFEKDSLKQAIKGGEKVKTSENKTITVPGLEKIEDEFSGTKAANLATYQLGCAYMKQGQFKKAIEKFEAFESNDVMLSSIALGAIGDCNMELKKTEEAILYYIKAADKKPNNFTTPLYLKKAGMAYEYTKKYSEAVGIYERILKEYGKSQEGRDITKFITRAKILGKI